MKSQQENSRQLSSSDFTARSSAASGQTQTQYDANSNRLLSLVTRLGQDTSLPRGFGTTMTSSSNVTLYPEDSWIHGQRPSSPMTLERLKGVLQEAMDLISEDLSDDENW